MYRVETLIEATATPRPAETAHPTADPSMASRRSLLSGH